MPEPIDRSEPSRLVRVTTLKDQGKEHDWAGTTIEQRWAAMWQLALDAWAMKGEPVEPRLPRHIVRIQYRES